MPRYLSVCSRLAAVAILAASAGTAFAHHGWSWTQDGFFQLEGLVQSVSYGNPHPTLEVNADGEIWTVELAPPRQSERAGVTADTIKQGAEITAIGNRSQDQNEKRMKAVRLITGGQTYDVYPGRTPSN